MDNTFPSRIETRFGWLRLPEFQVKRPVHLLNFSSLFKKILSHGYPLLLLAVSRPEPMRLQAAIDRFGLIEARSFPRFQAYLPTPTYR
jgi:hypothetical protein